ncbi:MAG: response regulator [Candidatus Helarchaeota archaeon]
MKPLILIIDDEADFLYNVKLFLESNDFDVITASNGIEALKILNNKKYGVPNIIICDIVMPEMDGYEFFENISKNSRWNKIPFIFLTNKTSIEDIRFGKMLGVDDYLTKPVNEEDLLVSIKGRILRSDNINKIKKQNKKSIDRFNKLRLTIDSSIKKENEAEIILIYVLWDDKIGPSIRATYPSTQNIQVPVNRISVQLFNSINSIYGNENIINAQSILLSIENIKRQGYVYFDSFKDIKIRGGNRRFMLALISPRISYFESLTIKNIFEELADKIKNKRDWDIKEYWKMISVVLIEK